jgi:general stress protein 26
MDYVEQNQLEHSRENLHGEAAIEKIRALVDNTRSCFFCTATAVDGSTGARPMSVQDVDAEGNLWFLSARDSHKDEELTIDPRVRLFFQGTDHGDFLEINGYGAVSQDRDKIAQLWKPVMKTWFSEGPDDPRISVIKVTATDGYYWETRHGLVIASIKMLVGTVTGKPMDDSVEGKLRL